MSDQNEWTCAVGDDGKTGFYQVNSIPVCTANRDKNLTGREAAQVRHAAERGRLGQIVRPPVERPVEGHILGRPIYRRDDNAQLPEPSGQLQQPDIIDLILVGRVWVPKESRR